MQDSFAVPKPSDINESKMKRSYNVDRSFVERVRIETDSIVDCGTFKGCTIWTPSAPVV